MYPITKMDSGQDFSSISTNVWEKETIVQWGENTSPATLDVCIVGINRADLLALTLQSFFDRLLYQWGDVRIIANIDPIPTEASLEVFQSVFARFATRGILRISREPGFALAVGWVWSQTTAKTIFHLEDDWLCLNSQKRMEIEKNLENMPPATVQVLLPKSSKSRDKGVSGFSLNPCFFNGTWVRNMSSKLKAEYDPEKQIKHGLIRCDFYSELPGCLLIRGKKLGPVIFDTGSVWKKYAGIRKILSSQNQYVWQIERDSNDFAWSVAMAALRFTNTMGPVYSRFVWAAHLMNDLIRRKGS